MIRNILLISSSGIVIWSRSFFPLPNLSITLLGSLLRTISELGHNNHLLPHYIEYDDIIVILKEYKITQKVFCALILSSPDFENLNLPIEPSGINSIINFQNFYLHQELPPLLGSLISRTILNAFIEEYGIDLDIASTGTSTYETFSFRVPGIIRDCIRYVLRNLVQSNDIKEYDSIPLFTINDEIPLIQHSMLIFDDNSYESFSSGRNTNRTDTTMDTISFNIDEVAIMSSVHPVLNASMELGKFGK